MASKEELVQIATNFLLNAPPCEFMEVVSDVRALLPNESLLNATAADTFREYNTTQMISVSTSKGQTLITKEGEVSANEYLDPKNKQVVSFDHIKQAVTGERSASGEIEQDIESIRSAFEEEAVKYCNEFYPNGVCAVYGNKVSEGTRITICISAALYNPNNYYSGRWRSTWVCTIAGSNVTSNGKIQINVHYYEDGNVQLNTITQKSCTSAAGDAKSTAVNALKAIGKVELNLHSSIDTSYSTMGDTTFKALRRALPINRSKINWQKVRGFKVGAELNQAK
ncbi:hypothetical protein DICPUDRAFT_97675 [Dictyostelium purpureum]|uniref:F-actin-capping protein subunit alpha n=1 Tax=Dictyostelium purpureum TaxID=5786 RepID=F0ZIU9_DICPU|nr:uncharacterized protein DICPUDRAFT_97675 [Dictyostelium purpureum]EGC36153.1 hypothetical protein DICPUDRAFT_97675 [Dictyostelium purpureum]|eukprot:XP_003287346.1 hypothetical protein DICPUDRAFT_97675 [Dictyostelium purpureum]